MMTICNYVLVRILFIFEIEWLQLHLGRATLALKRFDWQCVARIFSAALACS